MIDELRLMLGDSSSNYSDAFLGLILKNAINYVETYCNRELDFELKTIVVKIALIECNRANSQGLDSESYSGISYNYINGYPNDIKAVLNRKRKVKTL